MTGEWDHDVVPELRADAAKLSRQYSGAAKGRGVLLASAADEIELLRAVVRFYQPHVGMATAREEWQQAIDRAMIHGR